MPRILLIMPDAHIHRLNLGPLKTSFREAPLTLTTLAALVPDEIDAEIALADESVQPIPFDKPFDLVGISCLTGTAERGYAIADRFRKKGVPVVLGGVHATLMPAEAAEHADALVVGFAEKTWPRLLRDYIRGDMKPAYRQNGTYLSGLPHPRRDLQKPFGYMMPRTVFATRGCRGGCSFCTVPAVPFGWHTRPVAEVAAEIRSLPGRRFAFNDVNLIDDRDYATDLFTALIPLKKIWGGLATTQIADDPELLRLMAASGCQYLLLGFESIRPAALRGIRKGFNKAGEYRRVVETLHRHGIAVQGCFVFGLDADGPDVFEETAAAVNALGIDIPRYAVFTPYPGTKAHDQLSREGRLLHRHWRHYDTQHVVFRPARMSPEALDAGFIRAYEATFSIKNILKRAMGSPRFPVTFIGNLAYRLYIKRLKAGTGRILHP
jgi:radical SAM superfamily enzyme YgiQ (UPF0313 family)